MLIETFAQGTRDARASCIAARMALVPVMLMLVGCTAPPVQNDAAQADIETSAPLSNGDAPTDLPSPVAVATPDTAPKAISSPDVATLPAEVAKFKARRDECDHFRGEDPYDDARAVELASKVERACTGTDAALVTLRKRYSGNTAALAALSGYEDGIE